MTKSGFQLLRATAIAFAFFLGFAVDISPSVWQSGTVTVISQAGAVVGRPGTPGSVAGVARRTTRRAVRHGHYY
jgi:hypothetical protein